MSKLTARQSNESGAAEMRASDTSCCNRCRFGSGRSKISPLIGSKSRNSSSFVL